MSKDNHSANFQQLGKHNLDFPFFTGALEEILSSGKLFEIEGTNVVRVPFGVRRSRKHRPTHPERLATLVLPFQPQGSPTPPPQAA